MGGRTGNLIRVGKNHCTRIRFPLTQRQATIFQSTLTFGLGVKDQVLADATYNQGIKL